MNAKLIVLFVAVLISSACAHFKKRNCQPEIVYQPHYVTEYEEIPQYETIYKSSYFASPVILHVEKTQYVQKHVVEPAYKTVYTTIVHPQYVTETEYDTIYNTVFQNQIEPKYVTTTVYQPQQVYQTELIKQQIPVPTYVTKCNKY